METIYSKYADILINYSLGIKKNDKLLIFATYLAEPLLLEIYKKALEVGAHPELSININGSSKIFFDVAKENQLKYISPRYEYAVKNYDAFLHIRSEFNLHELENADMKKRNIYNQAMLNTKKIFLKGIAPEDPYGKTVKKEDKK